MIKNIENTIEINKLIKQSKAMKVINELSMQNDICIISKHMDSRKPLTQDWIYKTFPTIKLIFVDNFEDKGQALKEFGADIIIDDRVDALESCIDIPYRICFGNYQWNSFYNGLRANDWKELNKMIKNIENTIEINKLIKQSKEMRGIKGWEF